MGAIQEPTPAMGPYRTEVRRESFYLYGDTSSTQASDGPKRVDEHTLRVPAEHVANVLAALDQVRSHASWQMWRETGEHERQGITISRQGDHVLLRIPCDWVYEQQVSDGVSVTAEIEYRDVTDLYGKLADQLEGVAAS